MESNWGGAARQKRVAEQTECHYLADEQKSNSNISNKVCKKCFSFREAFYFWFGSRGNWQKVKYDKIQKVLRSSKTFLLIFPITNQGVHCLKVSKRKGGGVHQLWCLTTENQRERIISVRLVTRLKEKFNVIAQGLMMMNRWCKLYLIWHYCVDQIYQ